MKTNLQTALDQIAEHVTTVASSSIKVARVAERLLTGLALSESANFNLFAGSIWIETKERSDVEKVLAIAPPGQFWSKESEGELIAYKISIDGIGVALRCSDGALPPTCRVVEEDVLIPAQPERVEKRKVVRCVAPAPAVAPEDHPAGIEAIHDEQANNDLADVVTDLAASIRADAPPSQP